MWPAAMWRSLPVLVSSPHAGAAAAFGAAGVAPPRLLVDDAATDTVTNFTTALPLLRRANASHVVVLTSAAHAHRAASLAALLLRPAGIAATLVPLRDVPGAPPAESAARVLRDIARALCWHATGCTGASMGRLAHPERFWHLDAR